MTSQSEADAATGEEADEKPDAADTNKDMKGMSSEHSNAKGAQANATALFLKYFVVNFFLNAIVSAVVILLWSNLGLGEDVFKFLEKWSSWSSSCGFVFVVVLLVLYLLDFYWPPHLPGQVFRLWETDRVVGRLIFSIGLVFFVMACLLRAKTYPSIPVLITVMLCPFSACLVRRVLHPKEAQAQSNGKGSRKSDIINHGDLETKMELLRSITGEEVDTLSFYKACLTSYMLCFVACFIIWLIYAILNEAGLQYLNTGKTATDRDRLYVQWATPLVVAIANFVFGLYTMLRVFMQRAYSYTDSYKNRIIADCMRKDNFAAMGTENLELLRQARNSTVNVMEAAEEELERKRNQYLNSQDSYTKRLSLVVKVAGCMFILLISLLYVAGQLLYADTHIASLVMFAMGLFFISFVVFVYVAFGRVVKALEKWLVDLPAWQTAKRFMESDWALAFAVCPFLPFLPMILALSFLNQLVRRCRGIYNRYPDNSEHEQLSETRGAKSTFTPRVQHRLSYLMRTDWLSIATKCYILCFIYVCYTVVPPLLNVGLAWMNKALASLPFAVIVVSTFVVGVVAFLLPPVPGMTVYIFGGLVVSGSCPPRGTEQGFWVGAVVNIVMCWFLKLAACAVQQVCIGGMLGKSRWVRQTVGVHKPGIRCIEAVLRKKGWSVGKVAILCGGPDWPTSVLAGVLKLSLLQCELGTIPIIFFVLPCAMSGSLYLRKGESEMWSKSANLMIVSSVMVNMILWALAAWAIQNQLEQGYDELTRPLPQNVDLEWLDYRAAEIEKRCALGWKDIPCLFRSLYIIGALVHIMVNQALFWLYSSLFGDFQVSDDIDGLVFLGWTTEDGLITYSCLALLAIYTLAWICFFQLGIFRGRKTKAARTVAAKELDLKEAPWKENWLNEAFAWGTSQEKEQTTEEPVTAPAEDLDAAAFEGTHVTV